MTLHPISPSLATAMQMDARQIQFDAPVSAVPRVPTLLYPHMIGARLMSFPLFQRRWRQFASSATKAGVTAADAVRMAISGWVPELSGTPYQHTPPREPQWTARDVAAMTTITSELLTEQIIEPVPEPDFSNPMIRLAAAMSLCYYSGSPFLVPAMVLPFVHIMFAVPKPHSEKFRGVSGLSSFNKRWMIPKHFKMEGLHTVRQLLQALMFMTVIDLRAAYPTMGIHPRYRNYFIFRFRGQYYRYRGSVFGASSLPRAFTKLLRPICAFLRTFGVLLVIFLDDILVMNFSFAQCAQDTQDVITLLTYLGFVISTKEQVKLVPAQAQIWCGVHICSLTMMFSLPVEKLKKIQQKMRHVIRDCESGVQLTLKQWASVLGTMRSTMVCVLPALLFSQGVRRFVNAAITVDLACWARVMPLPPLEVIENLRRFGGPDLRKYNGRPIRPLPADLVTQSDASGFGGGMVSTKPLELEGRWHWLSGEAEKHINWKELVSHLKGFESLEMQCPGLVLNATIFNDTDNTVSMSYVNRQGGRVPELSYAAEALWYWLLARGCTIRDLYLPGVQNVKADTASRWYIDHSEYQLLPDLFRKIDDRFGPFSVDAFASRANCQVRPFWSRWGDPEAAARDGLRQPWARHNLYMFPPYPLIPRVLSLLRDQRVLSATLVAPLWTAQPWWPLLLSMTLDYQHLGVVHEVLRHPTIPNRKLNHSWRLAAFRLSGQCYNDRATMTALSSALFSDGNLSIPRAR